MDAGDCRVFIEIIDHRLSDIPCEPGRGYGIYSMTGSSSIERMVKFCQAGVAKQRVLLWYPFRRSPRILTNLLRNILVVVLVYLHIAIGRSLCYIITHKNAVRSIRTTQIHHHVASYITPCTKHR